MLAIGPMFPRLRTRVPLVKMPTELPIPVRFQASAGSRAIALQTRATPGV